MRCADLNAMRQESLSFHISETYNTLESARYHLREYVIPCNRELASRDYADQTKCARKYVVDRPDELRFTDLTI